MAVCLPATMKTVQRRLAFCFHLLTVKQLRMALDIHRSRHGNMLTNKITGLIILFGPSGYYITNKIMIVIILFRPSGLHGPSGSYHENMFYR